MVFKCSIFGCDSTNTTVRLHCFPKDDKIRKLWCKAVGRDDLENVSDRKRHTFRVCAKHFADDATFPTEHNRTNLKFNAVPTLFLGVDTEERVEGKIMSPSDIPEITSTIDSPKSVGTVSRDASNEATPPSSGTLHVPGTSTMGTPKRSRKGASRSPGLLKTVGVTRATNLTPKARQLYQIAKDLRKVKRRLYDQNLSNKERLSEALDYAESTDFLSTKVNKRALNFLNCQIKMLKLNPRGRRFTFDDKVFALSLLKQGARAYRLLRSTFALPSRKTLMNILNKIHFSPGIVPKVMDALKTYIANLDALDRHCVLMFDEMSLEPSLTYDRKWDEVVGFQDIDGNKTMKFADHVLVFMVKGLRKKWKQPISFHFSQGGMNSDQLKILLKNTILALQDVGLNIACTVCDQYAANVNSIKKLKEESVRPCASNIDLFEVGGQEIVTIYDPPHLLKGIRNNLVLYDLIFKIDNIEGKASWDHIIKLYELDVGDFNTKMCYKLTDAHIYKEKLKKMKVKHAAQVFSHRVSSTMRWTVNHGREGTLPKSAEETASFISFMDQVFDSVNGHSYDPEFGKELRCAVKVDSPHLKFWEKAIKIFNSARFITPKGGKLPPTIINWGKTLRGFIYLWRKLSNAGFKYLCLRRINQDPLEKFFGRIRSHGIRNINPTCYKAIIISNFSSPHSPHANCEDDKDNDTLDSLRSLLTIDVTSDTDVTEEDLEDISVSMFQEVEDLAIISTHAYIAGYIAKHLKKVIGKCARCINQLQSSISSEEHLFINELEYKPNLLLKTKTQFRRMFSGMVVLYSNNMQKYILGKNVRKRMTCLFKRKLYNPFLCQEHDLFNLYIEKFLLFFIYTYFKNINSILRGQIQSNIKNNDVLKIMAWQRYLALKNKNKKIKSVKQLA